MQTLSYNLARRQLNKCSLCLLWRRPDTRNIYASLAMWSSEITHPHYYNRGNCLTFTSVSWTHADLSYFQRLVHVRANGHTRADRTQSHMATGWICDVKSLARAKQWKQSSLNYNRDKFESTIVSVVDFVSRSDLHRRLMLEVKVNKGFTIFNVNFCFQLRK